MRWHQWISVVIASYCVRWVTHTVCTCHHSMELGGVAIHRFSMQMVNQSVVASVFERSQHQPAWNSLKWWNTTAMKRNHHNLIQPEISIGVAIKQVEYIALWVKMMCFNDFLICLYFVSVQSVQKYVIVPEVMKMR